MLTQLNTAIRFVAFFVESKVGKTGLTVTVDVYENGSAIVTGASASADGGGLYSYTLSSGSVDANANYVAIFKTATTTVDLQHIPSFFRAGEPWVERVDATISSRSSHTANNVRDAILSDSTPFAGAHISAIKDYVDTVETTLATLNTASTTLQGYVDQLEGYTDTLEASEATLTTNLAAAKTVIDQLALYTDTLETQLALVKTAAESAQANTADLPSVIEAGALTAEALAGIQASVLSGIGSLLTVTDVEGLTVLKTESLSGETTNFYRFLYCVCIEGPNKGTTPIQVAASAFDDPETTLQLASAPPVAPEVGDVFWLVGRAATS